MAKYKIAMLDYDYLLWLLTAYIAMNTLTFQHTNKSNSVYHCIQEHESNEVRDKEASTDNCREKERNDNKFKNQRNRHMSCIIGNE